MSDISRINNHPNRVGPTTTKPLPTHPTSKPAAPTDSQTPAAIYTPSDKEVEKGYEKHAHIYNKPKIDALKAEAEKSLQGLRDTVKAMLEKQGLVYQDVLSKLENGEAVEVAIDEETQLEAQAAIAEDGHWGVKKTSERIIEFAKALANDNPDYYDQLVSAIKEGFEAAKEAFGGELPEISQKTYDAVMEGLEAWKSPTETPIITEG